MNAEQTTIRSTLGRKEQIAEKVLQVIGILLCLAAAAYVAFWLIVGYAFRDAKIVF